MIKTVAVVLIIDAKTAAANFIQIKLRAEIPETKNKNCVLMISKIIDIFLLSDGKLAKSDKYDKEKSGKNPRC